MSQPDEPAAAPGVPVPGHRPDGEPRPVSEIDQNLFEQLQPLHRARWITLTAYALLVTVGLAVLAFLYFQQQAEVRASCRFYGALTSIPLTATPPATKPSRLAVTFIAGARDAYAGQGCPDPLPPAAPSLIHWGHVYGIPVRQ
jgi:hypothetical protein